MVNGPLVGRFCVYLWMVNFGAPDLLLVQFTLKNSFIRRKMRSVALMTG